MAKQLVPLKVKIGLGNDGAAKYPEFNTLSAVKNAGMDWSKYIDTHGLSWHYDNTSGHAETTADSPRGQQWGMLIIPKVFADEAIAAFPDECSKMTEAECQDFYDTKAHAHEPDELFDQQVLDGIKSKKDLGLALTPMQIKAADPNDSTPGIRKNENKFWADFKAKHSITIV